MKPEQMRESKFWDRVIYDSDDGLPVLFIKNLIHWRGRRLDLHKIVWPDKWGCFHSHPASWAVRIILWGGYIEEMFDGVMRYWRPGMVGIVRHDTIHRINRLRRERPSYSLWLRGRIRHDTWLRGDGWPAHQRDLPHRSSET